MRSPASPLADEEIDAARSSMTVSLWTLLSRLTGAGRVIVIGAVLGPTFFANTFLASTTIPNLIFLSVLGSVLGPVVVPALVRSVTDHGVRQTTEMVGRLAGLLLAVMGLGSLAVLISAPMLSRLLTAGIEDPGTSARAADFVWVMLVFTAPQVMLYMLAALGAAAQQARGRFALAAAAPAVENIGLVVTVVLAGALYAPRLDVADASIALPILLCAGSTVSVAAHMGLQLWGAARAGLPIRPRMWRRSDDLTRTVAQRMKQSFVIAACPEVTYFGLLAASATVPGGVLVLQIAHAVYSTLVALAARAVATAVLPGLARAAHCADMRGFAARVREGLGYTLIASVPPMVLVVIFAQPLANVVANGELRVAELIRTLGVCVAVLAVAQVAAGLHEVGRQALFARLDIVGPRCAALTGLAVTLLTISLGMLGTAEPQRLWVLGVAVLVGDLAAATVVLTLLRRALEPAALTDWRRLRAATVALTAMIPVLVIGWAAAPGAHGSQWADLVRTALVSALALAVFAEVLRRVSRHAEVAP